MLHHVGNAYVRRSSAAEPPDRVTQTSGNLLSTGIVRVDDGRAGPAGKLHERVFQRVHRTVTLEMVGLDVVDDGHRGMKSQKSFVELVSFDHEQFVTCNARIPAPAADPA